VYALHLPLSPEKTVFWECADLVDVSASETDTALQTSGVRPPGVSDSIELDNDYGVTRRASEGPKVLGEASQIEGIVTEYGRPT
jgi:hypothetical protein